MTLFTVDSKHRTIHRLISDEGERAIAAFRWDQIKDDAKRAVLYQVNAPDLTADEARYILKLEELYVNIYSEWEKDNITNEQYKVLQEHLPPEFFINIIAIYICTRFYDLPAVVSEIKAGTFELSEADHRYFNNYLRIIYKPSIEEFIEKSKELRPRTEAYNELVQLMAGALDKKKNGQTYYSESDNEKVASLMLQLNEGMSLLMSCLNNGAGAQHDSSEVFEDLTPTLEAYSVSKNKAGAVVDTPIEKAQAIYADNFLMNSTKAAQNIGEITEYGQAHGYVVSRTKGKKKPKEESIVTVMLSPAESDSVKLTRPITLTDRAIIEAVETLAQYNTYITAAEVYRMMNGGENIRMRPELIEEIENRIDYMRRIMAYIDYSQHMAMNGHEGKYTREDTLLNLTKERVSLNGKTVTAYKYKDVSPLFKYARDVGQIVSVPSAMLSTRSGQKGGTRAQAIKHYLLQRLFTIKGQGTIISLETLLKAIGEPEPSPDQLKNIRSIIENFLELWSYGKIRTNKTAPNKEILEKTPIKGFSVNTVGRKITGYTLIPKVLEVATK